MKNSRLFPHIIEMHLADHCNLNCRGCSHFSSLLSEPVFMDLGNFRHDLTGLKGLFDDVYEIRLMGGEPLLNPQINSFIISTRRIFPKTNIAVFTNGVLLPNTPSIFWTTCADNNVQIKISRYPIKLDVNAILEIARSYDVKVKIPNQIESFMQFINIKGNSNPQKSFRNCRAMYTTPFLQDGKLFSCSFAPHVHIFNEYFSKDIPVTEGDFIDIHNPEILQEDIFTFLDHPIPLCKWCRTKRSSIRWGRSQMDINEWIGGDVNGLSYFFQISNYYAISTYHRLRQISEIKKRNRNEY